MWSRFARRLVTAAAAMIAAAVVAAALSTNVAAADGDAPADSAADLKARILAAVEKRTARDLNEALRLLGRLEKECADEKAKEVIGFAALAKQTIQTRDTYFRKEVQVRVLAEMRKRIAAKVKEPKEVRPRGAAKPAAPEPGSFDAARQWAARELPKLLWDTVASDLDLKAEEVERYWKERSGKATATASYGTGTFLAGSPLPGEYWWEQHARRLAVRHEWLTAHFVESSGLFEIVSAEQSEKCQHCGGNGIVIQNQADGTQRHVKCPNCDGVAKFRVVTYR